MAKHPNKFGDHCPACMMGQSSNAGEGTHLEGTIEHPQATAPLPEPRSDWTAYPRSANPEPDDEAVVRAAFPPYTHWFQRTPEDWKKLRSNSKQVQDFESVHRSVRPTATNEIAAVIVHENNHISCSETRTQCNYVDTPSESRCILEEGHDGPCTATAAPMAPLPEIASEPEKCRYCKCSRSAHPNDGPCTACNCEGWDTNRIEAGEWIQPFTEGYRMSCCDCGLVHLMDFRIHEGMIQFRAFRADERVAPCAAPPLDDYPPPIVRTLLDIAAEIIWPRKKIILDAANELLTRKGE